MDLVGGTQEPVWSRTLPSSHTQAGVHPPACTCTSLRCRVEQVAWRKCWWRVAPRVPGRETGPHSWQHHTWARPPRPPWLAGRTTWPRHRCTPARLPGNEGQRSTRNTRAPFLLSIHTFTSTTSHHQLGLHLTSLVSGLNSLVPGGEASSPV